MLAFLNLCLHLFCLGALPLLCPSCPLSRESSHVVAVLTGWSLTCHLLFETVLKKHHELSAARKAWRASLSGDLLTLCGSWDFPLFQRLLDEAGYEDKHLLHDISSLPLTGLAPFLAYCHPNLCTQPFLCPSFGQVFLSVMLNYSTASAPPVTPSWIVAQVTKPTKNLLLALWTDHTTPLKSALGSTKC